jgi:hypothetical protein
MICPAQHLLLLRQATFKPKPQNVRCDLPVDVGHRASGWSASLLLLRHLVPHPIYEIISKSFGRLATSVIAPVRPGLIPVSLTVGLIPGIVGASGMISITFYLNYGLTKERIIATGAFHSLFIIQLTKNLQPTDHLALSALGPLQSARAPASKPSSLSTTRHALERFKEIRFRRLAIEMMLISGASMLWQSRYLFI